MFGYGVSRGQKCRPARPLKLLLLGDYAVGKSSLILRLCQRQFWIPSSHPANDFIIRMMDIDGNQVRVGIWDTLGLELHRTIPEAYYRNAHGIMLLYDITSRSSFNNVRGWMRSVEEHSPQGVRVLLVGTKADMDDQRSISKEEGQQLANELDAHFFETSAKIGINVDAVFEYIAREGKQQYDKTNSLHMEASSCVDLEQKTANVPVVSISSYCA
ncbi:unnamed protein product [Closterium sp. Yama58-4]|nr:unnamed protein product [Closterium sp. Yama58-4]